MSMPGMNPAVEGEISSKATTALVTGILSLVCCQPLGIIAIISGNKALALIEQTGAGKDHASKASIGKICGIIGVVLMCLGIALWVISIVLGLGAAAIQQ